jgi:predicted metal-binding membrane protein
MKKSDATEQVITRRKALGRIGLFATAAYTVPAFATLSMAHASSGASGTSTASEASTSSDASDASDASAASEASTASGPSASGVEATCGLPGDEGYDACLIENGWEGYVAP